MVPQRCVTGSVEAAALGASVSAAALGASESTAALGASESAAALGASESAAAPDASASAVALGARASPATGPSLAEALHTFTLDSGASRCFFRDCTTLTTLAAPVPVSLADPTGGPVVARVSDVRWLRRFRCLRLVSLQRLACISMHSRLLVYGLPRSLPSLPHSPAPPCLPCVEGRQRTTPHSSGFPPTTTPLQTLNMDVWGPAPVGGTDQECYFLPVVDDYTRYTTVFPLRRKADISRVLIPWIHATHRQMRERFSQDLPVLRLHSDRGGEFSSNLIAEFCRDESIHQLFTLPASPHKNGIAECRIGLIMEVARTSMIHAAAPHFMWLFVVRYAAHQLNLWPRVSEPETSPTLWWTWKVGDALAFRVWGALSLVRDAKASMLSSRTLRCVFLGFPTDAPPWQFYHPRERRVFSSQDVTFDESVCFYRLHPHASHPGLAPLGVSQVDPPPLVEPLEISSDSSGPAEGGDPAADDTAATRRSPRLETPLGFPPRSSSPHPQPAAVDSEAETASVELGGARTRGAGAAKAGAAAGAGGATGASDQSPPQLLRGSSLPAPAPHTEVTECLSEHHEPENRASTPDCARRVARPRPPAVPDTHGMALRPSSVPQRVVLPEPPMSSLLHVLDPESDLARAASPTVIRLLATVVTDPDFESTGAFVLVIELVDFAAMSRLDYVASLVTQSESVCPPTIGGELALSSDSLEDRQFKLECLAIALPRFASMLLCHEGNLDALDIPTPRSYAEAIVGDYTSQWQTAMDAKMASWKSTGTYVNEVPPLGANIVNGIWIFKGVDFFQTFSPTPKMTTLQVLLHVAAQHDYELHSLDFSTALVQGSLHEEIWLRRPPGFTGSFPAGTRTKLVALGFAPSTADPSLILRTNTTLPPFYVLVYVNDLVFATANTEALAILKAELQERHTCTNLGELRSYLGLQITRDRARHTITLIQSHMVYRVLQRFGFHFSSPQPTLLSPGHSLSAPPSNESGMGLVLQGEGSVVLTGHSDASWADNQATQRSSQCYTFSLGSGSVSWRSSRSSSVLGSNSEAEIYAGAMAAQDLCWLT
ncbi:unnamed protein product [Closterium sp. NIES-53]